MEQSLIDCFHNDKSLFCLIGSPGLLLMTLEWEYDDVVGMGIEGQIRYILPHYPERARKKKSNGKENISYGANAPFAETGRCSPGEEILLLALC